MTPLRAITLKDIKPDAPVWFRGQWVKINYIDENGNVRYFPPNHPGSPKGPQRPNRTIYQCGGTATFSGPPVSLNDFLLLAMVDAS